MWRCGSSPRRAMRDTLLAATMAPSLPRSGSVCCCCCSFQLCGHTAPSCPIRSVALMVHRQIGIVFFLFFWLGGKSRTRTGRTDRERGEARGGCDGATLVLHRYGKRSSKDTERRDRGRIQVVRGCMFSIFFLLAVIQVFLKKF